MDPDSWSHVKTLSFPFFLSPFFDLSFIFKFVFKKIRKNFRTTRQIFTQNFFAEKVEKSGNTRRRRRKKKP